MSLCDLQQTDWLLQFISYICDSRCKCQLETWDGLEKVFAKNKKTSLKASKNEFIHFPKRGSTVKRLQTSTQIPNGDTSEIFVGWTANKACVSLPSGLFLRYIFSLAAVSTVLTAELLRGRKSSHLLDDFTCQQSSCLTVTGGKWATVQLWFQHFCVWLE